MEAGEGGGDTTVTSRNVFTVTSAHDHRGELGQPVETDANRELRRRGSQRAVTSTPELGVVGLQVGYVPVPRG